MFRKYDSEVIKNTVDMAWPAVIESFFTALTGLVDSYMVSSLGSAAVAAVGITTQPRMLALSAFMAVNVAVSALVARRRGEQRKDSANGILLSAIIFIMISSVIISGIFVGLADPIIRFCGSNEDTHVLSVTYFRIVMAGILFNCIQMGINAAQRGAGNTKITMRTNLTSNGVNILFNYLLIGGNLGFPALGIKGAAIATVLGWAAAGLMSVISVMDTGCFVSLPYIFKNKIRPTMESIGSIIKVGYGIFFERLLMRIGFMLTAIMAADQGTAAMAAHQVGMNIMNLSFSFGDGFQATAVALIGRSLGQKDKELAREYGRTCRMLGGIIAVCLAVAYFFGGRALMSAFFDDAYTIDIGTDLTRVIMFIVIIQIGQVIYNGCLRGAGDTLYTAVVSIVSVTVVRTLGSYLGGYVFDLGIVGIWLGILADQIARYILGSVRFKQGKWTEIRI
ncbi:MAG: MATE family efflux transporter [Lachnospiraceae bacterium]|nr:MATE family efflux transporter [Lachnospiraceae bacterium]